MNSWKNIWQEYQEQEYNNPNPNPNPKSQLTRKRMNESDQIIN